MKLNYPANATVKVRRYQRYTEVKSVYIPQVVCPGKGTLPMRTRVVLPVALLAALFVISNAPEAKAFEMLDRMMGWNSHGGGGSGCCEPSCCEQTCCQPEPSCCEPVSCCKPRSRLRDMFRCCKKSSCCETSCCETTCCDAAPTCQAEPACCQPEPSCCEPAPCCKPRCRPFRDFCNSMKRCCKKSSCCEVSCCETSCCDAAPSCCN